jgi:hypothetical protein
MDPILITELEFSGEALAFNKGRQLAKPNHINIIVIIKRNK